MRGAGEEGGGGAEGVRWGRGWGAGGVRWVRRGEDLTVALQKGGGVSREGGRTGLSGAREEVGSRRSLGGLGGVL